MSDQPALVAVRRTAAGFEVYDCDGVLRGVAVRTDQLWSLMDDVVQTSRPTELLTPEKAAIETVVRETGSMIGNFLETRHPNAAVFARNVIRGAAIAHRHGLFDK